MKRAIFFLSLALQAQDYTKPGINAGTTTPPTCSVDNPGACKASGAASCDATYWKARAEWLEQQIAALNEQMTAMGSFFTAKDKLTAIKAQEPPKPHPAQPDKP